jgi:hypothetical protein
VIEKRGWKYVSIARSYSDIKKYMQNPDTTEYAPILLNKCTRHSRMHANQLCKSLSVNVRFFSRVREYN